MTHQGQTWGGPQGQHNWPPNILTHQVPLHQRLLGLIVGQLVVAIYLYVLAPRAKPGLTRLLLCSPAIVVLAVACCFFDSEAEVLPRTSAIFLCGWLGTHKVLAWCLNRGPLLEYSSFAQFLALLYLPIFPQSREASASQDAAAAAQDSGGGAAGLAQEEAKKKQGRLQDQAGHPALLLAQAVAKITLLGLVVALIMFVKMPRVLLHLCYSFGLVGFLGVLMDAPASLATSVLGLRIIPTFDQPWYSSSLADFWGRRWNISTSAVLRTLVYDPIVEGSWVKPSRPAAPAAQASSSSRSTSPAVDAAQQQPAAPPATADAASSQQQHQQQDQHHRHQHQSQQGPRAGGGGRVRVAAWRRAVGMCATFLASGLAHEAIIQMLLRTPEGGRRTWTWKWTAFFTLQGPLLVLELQLKRVWRQAGLRPLNVWVGRALTIALLLALADPLFYSPVDTDSDLADRVCNQVGGNFVAVGQLLAGLVWPQQHQAAGAQLGASTAGGSGPLHAAAAAAAAVASHGEL